MKGKKEFIIMSAAEYAAYRDPSITKRAVNKMIAYLQVNEIALPNYRLPGVVKIEKLGKAAILYIKKHSNESNHPHITTKDTAVAKS